jgi:hypothetical protein
MQTLAYFEPQPDITVFELAQVLAVVIGGVNHTLEEVCFKFPSTNGEPANSNLEKMRERYPEILRHLRFVVEWKAQATEGATEI